MTLFVVCAGLMLAIALILLLRPLLAGSGAGNSKLAALQAAQAAGVIDADEFARKRAALGAEDNGGGSARPAMIWVWVIALLLPLGATFLYWMNGDPRAFHLEQYDKLAQAARGENTGGNAQDAPDMNEAINGLAERMAKDGGDLEGWVLLGRAYKSTQRYAEAADALAKAQALAPQDPNIMVERAEVIALTDPDRRIAGQARGLLEQALLAQPENQRAMWLMGISNVQAGEYEQAVTIWERLLPLLPPGENVTESVREQIAQARAHAGMPPAAGAAAPVAVSAAPEPSATPTDATGATKLVVEIDIAPELKAQLGANDVLYVFARAPQGPKMPLAIQRMPVSSFPVTVTLDDSMGMMPSMKLSSVPEVVVGARVSKTGVANAQSGDFEVISAPVTLATQSATLKLTINSVVP